MKRWTPVLCGLLALGGALALEYSVEESGGPEGLAQAVAEAFGAWQGLEPSLSADPTEGASTILRYGAAERFGPDALTLTVQRQAPERRLEVLVNPASASETALLHETGLLLGLGLADAGVLNPAIGEALELGELERAELSALAAFAPADLDRSGAVDFYDLLELAAAFGQEGVSLPGDLDENGVIDGDDLELLRATYTFGPPSPSPRAPEEPSALEDTDALPDVPAPDAGEDAPEDPPLEDPELEDPEGAGDGDETSDENEDETGNEDEDGAGE